ncbi:MAG TPA: SMP-30/gluconolactonase/LRE family protein [Bryobacteraceae bacterium]|nr:SMP-30/gluconolactonase/LRE family protein [Bryobacteraceae bacterium]
MLGQVYYYLFADSHKACAQASRLALQLAFCIFCGLRLSGQSYVISTAAGGTTATAGQTASSASVTPSAAAVDASGNVYFVSGNAVFEIKSGVLLRVAGSVAVPGYAGDLGPATSAMLSDPEGLAVDLAGNLYLADTGNNCVRRVYPNGTIVTIAGTGAYGYAGDGAAATSATLANPAGIAVDTAGNVYVADSGNHAIRKISASGIITTLAGNGVPGYSGDGGAAVNAELDNPTGVAVDSSRNVYVADMYNCVIREITASEEIVTFAGNRIPGYLGDGSQATTAELAYPTDVAVDGSGNVYIADSQNSVIRKVSTAGVIGTVAGNGTAGYAGDSGSATLGELNFPSGIAVTSSGTLYIADSGNSRVRQVTSSGTISTVAGNGAYAGSGNAALVNPAGVALDSAGNLYIADEGTNTIRKLSPAGTISTIGGTAVYGYSGDGAAATAAKFAYPAGIAVDTSGNVYVVDSYNSRVRKIATNGLVTTVAGNGRQGYSGNGSAATSAELNFPQGIAVDSAGNLFIADTNNSCIRKVSGGIITTIAGNGTAGYLGDNGPASASELNFPYGGAVDATGNVYIADTLNNVIRQISTTGTITTVAGNGFRGYSGDGGAPTSAELNFPVSVAVDASGSLYIADSENYVVRRVSAGTIATIAGQGRDGYAGDLGPASSAQLGQSHSLVLDSRADVYLADYSNSVVRMISPANSRAVLSIAQTQTVSSSAGITYTVSIANAGLAAASSGTVTVTEALPSGLTPKTLYGTGWTCSTTTCTRTDSLAAGTSYPPVIVTASIAAGAPLQVTNVATVSGGGSAPANSQILTNLASAGIAQPIGTSPAGGSGLSQTFTFTITDPNGWQNITLVDVLVNRYLNGVSACYIAILPSINTLLLVDNAGDAGGPFSSISLPGSGTAQNSQCTVAGSLSTITGSGNTLEVSLNLTFPNSFSGGRTVYVAAQNGVSNSGWQALSTWTVPGLVTSIGPGVAGVSPQRATTGFGQTFTFTFTDTNGWQDLAVLDVLINGGLNSVRSCYFAFVASGPTTGTLLLVDDAGDAGGPFQTVSLPGSGSASNSQCTVFGSGAYVSAIGTTLNLILPMSFSQSFGGNRLVFLAARNNSGSNSGWITVGSINVP